jgi:hypothetical protein
VRISAANIVTVRQIATDLQLHGLLAAVEGVVRSAEQNQETLDAARDSLQGDIAVQQLLFAISEDNFSDVCIQLLSRSSYLDNESIKEFASNLFLAVGQRHRRAPVYARLVLELSKHIDNDFFLDFVQRRL